MLKKYQVFVSSTFSDLEDARRAVTDALLRTDCFPSGMELFPANDSSQVDHIKKEIESSDFYLIISAGRYGSIDPNTGKSFTEIEYDYATEIGKPIFRLLHTDPLARLKGAEIESSNEGRLRLLEFRQKLQSSKLVRFWDTVELLQMEVIWALQAIIKENPAPGWVREQNQSQALAELSENYERKIAALEKKIAEYDRPTCEKLEMCFAVFGNSLTFKNTNDFLNEVGDFFEGKIVFVENLLDFMRAEVADESHAKAITAALQLDNIIKVRKTGEVIVLPGGRNLLQNAKLESILQNSTPG